MKRWIFVVRCLAVVTALSLAGCIPVDDLNGFWEKGHLDPSLEGHWQKEGVKHRADNEFISFEKAGDHYLRYSTRAASPDNTPSMKQQVKSVELGSHDFFIMRYDEDSLSPLLEGNEDGSSQLDSGPYKKGGGLERYRVAGNRMQIFHLNESILSKAISDGEVEGKIPQKNTDPHVTDLSRVSLACLDKRTIRFLAEAADDRSNWDRVESYRRIPDLAKAVGLSNTYPRTTETAVNTAVDIHLPDLKYFAEKETGTLRRHLQASPEWRVFEKRDEVVCYRRLYESRSWKVSLNGFESWYDRGEFTQKRSLFRFSEGGGGAFTNKYNRRRTIVVSPLAGETNLNVVSDNQGIQSYLVAGQKGLWFEFHEQSKQERRDMTAKILEWLKTFLSDLRESSAEVAAKGYARQLLPKNGVRKGSPLIDIEDGGQGGIYDVTAWVNPGAEGQVYLKVFNVESGERLSEDRMYPKSNEFIGWSSDSEELFFYNSHVTVYEGDWSHFYDARFELWFQPTKNVAEVKLVETTRQICGWQR